MLLTYADIPLLLNQGFGLRLPGDVDHVDRDIRRVDSHPFDTVMDPDELETWHKASFRLDDLRPLLPPKMWPGARVGSFTDGIQWPPEPAFRLNTLYWPSWGATRWAWFHCYITDEILEQLPQCDNTAHDLVLDSSDESDEDADNFIAASMFMLEPKPITLLGDNKLYLLTLVDQRFFWRDQDAGNFVVNRALDLPYSTTWQQLIDQVAANLNLDDGIIIPTEIEPDYAYPHPILTSRYTNAALLLDAISNSLGRRATFSLDGNVYLLNPDDAQATFKSNAALPATEHVRAGAALEVDEEEPDDEEEESPEAEEENAKEDEAEEIAADEEEDDEDGGGVGGDPDSPAVPPEEGIRRSAVSIPQFDFGGQGGGDESESDEEPNGQCERIPRAVNVVFHKKDCHSTADDVLNIPVLAVEFYPDADTTDYTHTIHTTATAYYDCNSRLLNQDAVNNLATRLAQAYYGFLHSNDDVEFACIVPFNPEPRTDAYLWVFNKTDISTRMMGQPYIPGDDTEVQHSLGQDPVGTCFWGQVVGYQPPSGYVPGVGGGDAGSGNRYQFVEVTPVAGGTFQRTPNGLVSCPDNSCFAYEANGSHEDLSGKYVKLCRGASGEYLFVSSGGIETRIVDVNDGESSNGTQIGPQGECLWPGRIVGLSSGGADFCSNPWTPTPPIDGKTQTEIDVWLTVIDQPGGSGTNGIKLTVGDRYFARFIEDYTLGDEKRPLYAIRKGPGPIVRFQLYTALVFGTGTRLANLLEWDGSGWAATEDVITVYDPFIAGPGFEFIGEAAIGLAPGYQGWCQLMPDSGLHEIVHMEHKARWIQGVLYQQLKTSDASQANCTLFNYWQGRNPDPAVAGLTVYNDIGLYGPTGAKFLAFYGDSGPDQYKLIWVQTQAKKIRFVLTANLSSGSAATTVATTDFWDGVDPGRTPTVFDPQGLWKRALIGGKGTAIWNEQDNSGVGQYQVVQCDQETLAYRGTCGAVLSSDSTVTVGSLVGMNSSPFGQIGTASSKSAKNLYGLASQASSNVCKIEWCDRASQWELTFLAPQTITPIVDMQLADPEVQVKTQNIKGWQDGPPSDWTNKLDGTDCPGS